jgi:serine/threonine-protein kinase
MIGTLLGNRYEILEKIGEGGMAEVYKAKCHLLNRFVAVKVLKEEYSSDKDFVDKFKAEAAAAGSISHSNIVNIYDVGSQDGKNYIIMEYVHGRTLKEVIIQNGKLDYNRALDVAIQIGKALECAHKTGVIHRDIKPQNILVTDDGTVKVTDFGIAKAANSVTITNTNKVMGSAHYFSPEQARGTFVDARTDIYSLGIVLYEMVAGRVPYDAESPVSVALKHLQEPVVPPKHLNSNLPEGLNNLIVKAMEKEPIARYQNIKDMILDLQRIKNNSSYKVDIGNNLDEHTKIMAPIQSENDENDEEEPKTNKKKLLLILIPLAILVILSGFFAGWYFTKNAAKDPGKTSTTLKEPVVPSIIGLDEKDAKKLVEEQGLKFQVVFREKSDKPQGTVLTSSPDEGAKVKPNSEVRVYVSAGPQSTDIPNLKDIDVNSASKMIENQGFQLGNKTYEFSDTVTKDSIIRQSPESGAQAEKNSKIDLVISKGPQFKYTTVPDLTGRSLAEAETLLASANLKLGNKTSLVTADANQNGKVVNQKPNPNTQNIKEGSIVDVTYYEYKAPEVTTVNVPNFVASKAKLKDAVNVVKGLGLEVDTVGNPDDIVVSQSPEPGPVKKGTKITLKALPTPAPQAQPQAQIQPQAQVKQ